MPLKSLIFALALGSVVLGLTGCMSEQERSGVNPKPFNAPASWELNPYGDQIRN